MAAMSYLSVIERYHEHEQLVKELLESILVGISDPVMLSDPGIRVRAMAEMANSYPFIELLYVLDGSGMQISDNVAIINRVVQAVPVGRNLNRSHRPYFSKTQQVESLKITHPYLSNASGKLCLSASYRIGDDDKQGYIVVDVNLTQLIEFMMGDSARRKATPLFKGVYSALVLGLFIMVMVLISMAAVDIVELLSQGVVPSGSIKPFGIIIFITLALAVFDLGKTILEEEVLMHKDIFRHSSTRRTITRFISTILIAISIEALLTMFKASLGEMKYVQPAILMMFAVVGLLVGLGIYVYLGAKAELLLKQANGKS
ncbi:PDC sensor domain-containing protein [Shewanella psychrotolerans]|uniref:PDC sensor domain-containing protein n=1 Tax=Shewanella psychrotolerans TaxID=2864206 RepID=UPI001C65A3A4|nr:PDC sensor domain-containing protein [Shewanella psychrotolerans]QYK01355.1 PDC sensor domain-containing protein [Shewanella psychrotolerans]